VPLVGGAFGVVVLLVGGAFGVVVLLVWWCFWCGGAFGGWQWAVINLKLF
jgi:hypothetical protein